MLHTSKQDHSLLHRLIHVYPGKGGLLLNAPVEQPGLSKLSVIGLGYVGLPLALHFLEKGFEVRGIDSDSSKVEALAKGVSYLPDVPDNQIDAAIRSERFLATSDYSAVENSDAVVICVPTPLNSDHTPDLRYLHTVCRQLGGHLQTGQLVVLESSSYPGTTKEVLLPMLEQQGFRVGEDLFLAYSPERIDPGNKAYTVEQIPKVVSGVTAACRARIVQLYGQAFEHVVPVSSTETAEMVKMLENTYRFVNISLIHELLLVCDSIHVDLWEVIRAASTKPYGFSPFFPGPGIGGHCIPVDPLYLQWKAKQLQIELSLIAESERINNRMPEYVAGEILRLLTGARSVLVYGVTYKRDINDVRESPALRILEVLSSSGVNVRYHDPYVPEIELHGQRFRSVDLSEDQLSQVEGVVILTDHTVLPVQFLLDHASWVYDARNATEGYSGEARIFRLGGRVCP